LSKQTGEDIQEQEKANIYQAKLRLKPTSW